MKKKQLLVGLVVSSLLLGIGGKRIDDTSMFLTTVQAIELGFDNIVGTYENTYGETVTVASNGLVSNATTGSSEHYLMTYDDQLAKYRLVHPDNPRLYFGTYTYDSKTQAVQYVTDPGPATPEQLQEFERRTTYYFKGGEPAKATTATPAADLPSDFVAEKGTFTVGGSVINVRQSPSATGPVIDSYQPGQQVNYDHRGTANGYRWISYISASGQRRYLAVGQDGGADFGTVTATVATTEKEETGGDFAKVSGEWVNGRGEKVSITADGIVTQNGKDFYETPDGNTVIKESKRLSPLTQNDQGTYDGLYMSQTRQSQFYTYSPKGTRLYSHPGTGADDLGIDEAKDRLILVSGEYSTLNLPLDAVLFTRVSDETKTVEGDEGATPSSSRSDSSSSSSAVTSSSSSSGSKTESSSALSSSSAPSPSARSSSQSSSGRLSASGTRSESVASSPKAPTRSSSSQPSSSVEDQQSQAQQAVHPVQKLYQRLTNRKTLPSTGEAVSVLGLVGGGLIALVLFVLKKRQGQNKSDQ